MNVPAVNILRSAVNLFVITRPLAALLLITCGINKFATILVCFNVFFTRFLTKFLHSLDVLTFEDPPLNISMGSYRMVRSPMAETVHEGQPSGIQFAVNDLVRQAEIDKFQLNETKCKELQISFSRSVDPFEAVTINNKPIEVVTSAKLLGLTISNNLKWNAHIENVIKKGASRLYLLRQLKRAKGDPAQLLCFYTTCIRPMSEYACQVFHNGLPEYLSEELEKIQRRALRIIFPDLGYQEALKECNITTLHQRRQWLTERLFNEIKDNSLHKLHGLLPPRNLSTVALRRKRAFNVPLCRTNRLMNSFIMHNAAIF